MNNKDELNEYSTVGTNIKGHIGNTLYDKDYNKMGKGNILNSTMLSQTSNPGGRRSFSDENKRPSASSDSLQKNNMVGNTKEMSNPIQFLLHRGDKADENEIRFESDEGELHPDKLRQDIAAGVYDEERVDPYFPTEDESQENTQNGSTKSQKNGHPQQNGISDNDRNGISNAEISGSTDHINNNVNNNTSVATSSGRVKQRPQLKNRKSNKGSESDQQDLDDLQSTWKRRFKFSTGPTSLTFNMGTNNVGGNPNNSSACAPETPGGDGKKWKDFRSSILGFKKKEKPQNAPVTEILREDIDKELDEKTKQRAEFLITSLVAGCPAALLASSIFLRDEHGTQRAPLLPSLLGFQLIDITESSKHKHKTFRIELEYGLSPSRLKWSIIKDTRDFLLLQSRLKLLFFQSNAFSKKDVELPKLPHWEHEVRAVRHRVNVANKPLGNILNDSTANLFPQQDALHSRNVESHNDRDELSSIESLFSHSSRTIRQNISHLLSRISSRTGREGDAQELGELSRLFKEAMERYINQLNITLALRPQSNRLFQFFELSPIGVLLSSENGYQGKQGYLLVRTSAKAQGWRVGHLKFRELKDMVDRHTNKWFLIRNSYITYVEDIYSTTPLEVFLVDSSFKVDFTGANDSMSKNPLESEDEGSLLDEVENLNELKKKSPYLTIKLENNERKIKMIVRSERQLNLWLTSINNMISKTIWSQPKRFGSFAPVRNNCFAQWFVDGRDYMWACSSALEMAKETIYIHDWWLSPELYMRRPANGNQQWRLDRILKRKAEQGVKIFVIIYRNVGNTVVTDSSWTKHSLLDLHPNIYVIRSPNQLLQNTYFWAHHEKLCVVDSTVCFLGGIDLCFGRFDTPDHVLTDDVPNAFPESGNYSRVANENDIKFQNFPGKDYSNPRVKDFFSLDKPYESMYDRNEVPRMPWHDVHMISAGQIARDLSRHFVQRWNYLLRQKRPSRPTPLLVPPSDMTPEEVVKSGLDGTCEVQLLRSSGNWSLGLRKHEQSIQEAYLKIIETSEHFVYLENQFFITSAEWDGTVIHNRIGDALVDRIIRAHTEGKDWRAVIVIPLMPGFEAQVSEADGSSVRVIMQCQFMSISRGSTSIFAKLKKVGIDPDDYIQFFSLRKWGKIGPDKKLVTEQLYIHAKTIMADDRVAIIGSANINERSMRGDRDSEVAAIVRDKEMIKTTMNGKPYLAGKFAHTLRMRLMREHLGVDVDMLELVERRFGQLETIAKTDIGKCASTGKFTSEDHHITSAMVELATREILNQNKGTDRWYSFMKAIGANTNIDIPMEEEELPESLKGAKKYVPHPLYHSFNHRAGIANLGMRDKKKFSSDSRIHNNKDHRNDIDGLGKDKYKSDSFERSSKYINKIIQGWATNSMNTSETFLPHVEEVLEYLNDDGIDYNGDVLKELNEEEELYLMEKNKERWLFLKRIAYLQRCAGKQKSLDESTNAKSNIGPTNSFAKSDSQNSSQDGKHDIDEIHTTTLDDQGIQDALQSFVSTGNPNYDQFIDPYGFEDPLDVEFYEDVWYANAVRNTRLYRMIFHCQPDDAAESWTDYTRVTNLETEFAKAQKQAVSSKPETESPERANGGEANEISPPGLGVLGLRSREGHSQTDLNNKAQGSDPSTTTTSKDGLYPVKLGAKESPLSDQQHQSSPLLSEDEEQNQEKRRRRRAGTFASRHRNATFGEIIYDKQTAEKILSHIQGHLVLFPADWLHMELEKGGSWFFNADRLPPIEIYD